MAAKVGLTGGIGSGKSTVGKLFGAYGVMVIDADQIAKKVTAPGTGALQKIQHHFGDHCIQADGSLDRKKLGSMIFDSSAERIWLEQLLHPLIRRESDAQASLADDPYCVLEIPLLQETGRHTEMDAVIVVHCAQSIRQKRLVEDRDMDLDTIRRIFDSQASDEARLQIADYVVDNNGAREALPNQVNQIHRQLCELFR